MITKKLFLKSLIWQIIGISWISLLSYFWFGNFMRSIGFSFIVTIVSIFLYILYEKLWYRISDNEK